MTESTQKKPHKSKLFDKEAGLALDELAKQTIGAKQLEQPKEDFLDKKFGA